MLHRLLFTFGVIATLPLVPLTGIGFFLTIDDRETPGYFECLFIGAVFLSMMVGLIPYLIASFIKWLFTGSGLGWFD